jgi:uncharacterized protein YndB with AHSA1/START domain
MRSPISWSVMMADLTLVVRRVVKAPIDRVWRAWTRAESVAKWWGPAPVCCSGAEIDLCVGGRYRIGNRLPDGREIVIEGAFEVVDPPRRLVYSWIVDGGAEERVTVRFEERGGDTEIVIAHEKIANETVRTGHERGWDGCLDGLERFLL